MKCVLIIAIYLKRCSNARAPHDADSINSAVEDHLSITEKKVNVALPARHSNKTDGSAISRYSKS